MAGRFSFKVRNCGGLLVCADQREDWSLGQSTSIFLKIKKLSIELWNKEILQKIYIFSLSSTAQLAVESHHI